MMEVTLIEQLHEAAHAISQYEPENSAIGELLTKAGTALTTATAEAEALRARVAELKAALEPFAKCCEQIPDDAYDSEWAKFRLTIGDYRHARAALERQP